MPVDIDPDVMIVSQVTSFSGPALAGCTWPGRAGPQLRGRVSQRLAVGDSWAQPSQLQTVTRDTGTRGHYMSHTDTGDHVLTG